MAFATTNVQRSYFGDLKVLYGDWSGAAGDANGSVTVEGGRVYLANFMCEDASAPGPTLQYDVPIAVSVSGSTATITVYNSGAVTLGRFIIIYK